MPVPPPATSQVNDRLEQSRRFVVLLGQNDGSLPAAADEVNWLIPLSASHAIGTSQRLCTISLRVDLKRANKRLVDTATPIGHNRIATLCYLDDAGSLHQLGFGRIASESQLIAAETEGVQITARVEEDMIAPNKLVSHWHREPTISGRDNYRMVENAIYFNPRVDGRTVGNCCETPIAIDGELIYVWQDSDQTFDTTGFSAIRWTLPRAVHSMCWLLNPDETYVLNPLLSELEAVLQDASIDADRLLRNVVIDIGATLRDALNVLLKPLRFGWRLDFGDSVGDKAKLVVFKLREGIQHNLQIARPDTPLTRTTNNLDYYSAQISIADLANRVKGFGGFIEYEDSWELWPCWEPSLDTNPDTTPQRVASMTDADQAQNGNVWRLFGRNEAGQYSYLQRANMPEPVDTADMLLGLDDQPSACRKRRFHPCLSQSLKDGKPLSHHGFALEVRDENDLTKWKRVDWDFEVLDDELSIRLQRPQSEVQFSMSSSTHADEAPLRLTASVRTDYRLWGDATRRSATSPNGSDITAVLDLTRQFGYRRVRSTSALYADHHEGITAIAHHSITVAAELPSSIKSGERVAILDSTDCDGTYTIDAIAVGTNTTTITTIEKLAGATADGVLAFRTHEQSDAQRIQRHVERIRNVDDVAEISASLTMDRFEPSITIGGLVAQIGGRNLSLDAATAGAPVPSYLTIVGINYALTGGQKTELLTETFKGENYDDGEE